MEERPYQNDGAHDLGDMSDVGDPHDTSAESVASVASASRDAEALLSATVPLVDERFRLQLEERLVARLQGGRGRQAQAQAQAQADTAPERPGVHAASIGRATGAKWADRVTPHAAPHAAPQAPVPSRSIPATGGFRRGMSRAASVAIGVVGVALLALLFVGMAALLQSRQPQSTKPGGGPGVTPTPPGIRYQSPEEFVADLTMVADWKTTLLGSDSIAWSPDGKRLATASVSSITVPASDGNQESVVLTFDGPGVLQGIVWSPDGRLLAARQFDGSGSRGPDAPQGFVLLLDPNNGLRSVHALSHPRRVISMAWSPDGRTLATTDGVQITLWDVDTGKVREEYSPAWPVLEGNTGNYLVTNLAWSSNGRLAASLYRTVKVWDAASWRELASFENPGGVIRMAWAPAGNVLGVVAVDESNKPNNVVVLWDTASGKELLKLGPFTQVSGISWSARINILAAGILDPQQDKSRVELYQVGTGRLLRTLNMTATDLAWSPDGNTLAVAESRGNNQTGLVVLLSASTPETSGPVPTPTGLPTLPPSEAATRTAVASMTVVPVPTEIPGIQATLVAHATASPYPTSAVPTVQTGQPSIATVRRGDLTIELRLDDNRYLAGENGQALVTIRNEGSEKLYVGDSRLALVDEQGEVQPPWPPMPTNLDGWPEDWPGWDNHPWGLMELQPGGVTSSTFTFQVPGVGQQTRHTYEPPSTVEPTRHTYTLRTSATLSRSRPDGRGHDGIMLDAQAGPLPLEVSEPQPGQYLGADLRVDQKGWILLVTDGEGLPPTGPFWGSVEVRFSNGWSSWLLSEPSQTVDTAGGGPVWSMSWPEHLAREVQNKSEIKMRVWVAARGYVPAVASATLPGTTPALPGAVPTLPAPPPVPPVPVLTPTPVPPLATATAAPIEPPTPPAGSASPPSQISPILPTTTVTLSPEEKRLRQEEEIRVALFRYQMARNYEPTWRATAYCLSVGTAPLQSLTTEFNDPPQTIMQRFSGLEPPVKPVSQCSRSMDEGVRDVPGGGGKPALILIAHNIRWLSDTEVEVEGGYYCGGECGSGRRYRMSLEGASWVVKEDVLVWQA